MAGNEGRGNGIYGYSDHLGRPVIMDQYSWKQPIIIIYNPPNHNTERYVTKKETIAEHVYTAMVTEYKYGLPSMAEEQFMDYGINNGRTQTYVVTPTVEPYRDYGVNDDKWRRTSSPIYDRPKKVEEVIQPSRTGPIPGIYWRNAANPVEPTGHRGEYKNFNYDDEKANGYYRIIEHVSEPPVTSVGGVAMPIGRPLTIPTNDVNGFGMPISRPLTIPTNEVGGYGRPIGRQLMGPTNDINKAVGFLNEGAAKSLPITTTTASPARFAEAPVLDFPKRGSYTETNDSREAAWPYGQPKSNTGESYTRTITSTEAKELYGGHIRTSRAGPKV